MKEQLEAIRKSALESIAGTQAGADLEALGSSTWAKRVS